MSRVHNAKTSYKSGPSCTTYFVRTMGTHLSLWRSLSDTREWHYVQMSNEMTQRTSVTWNKIDHRCTIGFQTNQHNSSLDYITIFTTNSSCIHRTPHIWNILHIWISLDESEWNCSSRRSWYSARRSCDSPLLGGGGEFSISIRSEYLSKHRSPGRVLG